MPFRGEGAESLGMRMGHTELHLDLILKGMRAMERIQTTVAQEACERNRAAQGTPGAEGEQPGADTEF